MKTLAAILLLLMVGISVEARAEEEDDSMAETNLVVLGMSRNHAGTVEEAQAMADALDFAFSTRDLVYDKENGLRWPDDFDDEMWAGGYTPRRYDHACGATKKGCITVEKSDSYPGLKSGYFVIVAGLATGEEVKERLAAVKRVVPDAYLAETTLYMGCLH